jgi:tRNA (guanine10-N2)-methyltransferase
MLISNQSPFCIISAASPLHAARLIRRAILVQTVHELWGHGTTLSALHASIQRPDHLPLFAPHKNASFKFLFDSYQGKRASSAQRNIINTFAYLPLSGPISLTSPDQTFTIAEHWPYRSIERGITDPDHIYLGRLIGSGARDLARVFDLKSRGYISTTSMDSTLSLVGANIALAAPGKLFYDPFVGTGGLPLACAHFGAVGFGSDIDGRAIRGETEDCGGTLRAGDARRSVRGNFEQYGLRDGFGDLWAADVTNSPVRKGRLFDGIVCDPPYGVREGLRVLGVRDPVKSAAILMASPERSKEKSFVPPKRPYSFLRLLDDILRFAAETLAVEGRLSFWMPSANDQDQELAIPRNPHLELVSMCVQPFGAWSRRLLTYRRIPDKDVDLSAAAEAKENELANGTTADELNPFRRAYFKGFKEPDDIQ